MSAFGVISDGPNNSLRQKLMVMENAVAQVTAVKNQLRINAEIARKEIGNAIGHQLSLVRAREQLLLNILENVLESKERVLCEQQEQLNQAIGACQQSLESSPRGANDVNTNMLFRISALDLRPHTNSHLIFQCDPSDMRRAMYNFGQVISDPSIKDRSDCLALEAEEYEDSVNLAHKSVLRIHRGNTPQLNEGVNTPSEPLPSSISDWLYQSRQNTNNDNMDTARSRLYSTNSSIDIISKSEFDQESNGIEALRLPMDQWLRKPSSKELVEAAIPENLFPGLKRGSPKSDQIIQQTLKFLSEQFSEPRIQPSPPTSFIKSSSDLNATIKKPIVQKKKSFEFENVINSIKESDTSNWLVSPKKIQGSTNESVKAFLKCLPPTFNFENAIEKYSKGEAETCTEEKTSKVLSPEITQRKIKKYPNMHASWLKKNSKKITHYSTNHSPEKTFTPLQRDLEWKEVFETVHDSNEDEWLAPASRQRDV